MSKETKQSESDIMRNNMTRLFQSLISGNSHRRVLNDGQTELIYTRIELGNSANISNEDFLALEQSRSGSQRLPQEQVRTLIDLYNNSLLTVFGGDSRPVTRINVYQQEEVRGPADVFDDSQNVAGQSMHFEIYLPIGQYQTLCDTYYKLSQEKIAAARGAASGLLESKDLPAGIGDNLGEMLTTRDGANVSTVNRISNQRSKEAVHRHVTNPRKQEVNKATGVSDSTILNIISDYEIPNPSIDAFDSEVLEDGKSNTKAR